MTLPSLLGLILPLSILVTSCSKKDTYIVPTNTMEPTIPSGSYVVVDHNAYQKSDPIRWDVIAFEPPSASYPPGWSKPKKGQTWIMRVIGIPGETVDYSGDEIFVNGNLLNLPPELKTIRYVGIKNLNLKQVSEESSIELKNNEYFVLGDNSPNSNDSRFWGAVPRKLIKGKLENQ